MCGVCVCARARVYVRMCCVSVMLTSVIVPNEITHFVGCLVMDRKPVSLDRRRILNLFFLFSFFLLLLLTPSQSKTCESQSADSSKTTTRSALEKHPRPDKILPIWETI